MTTEAAEPEAPAPRVEEPAALEGSKGEETSAAEAGSKAGSKAGSNVKDEGPWTDDLPAMLAVGLLVLVILAMLHRLGLAVDFTDEAFSTALPYRFALGDKPFIDEINSAQTAGMLVWPFVWVFLKIKGSSTGLIWFMRCLFLVFKLGIAAAVFRTVRRFVSWPLALASSLFCTVFVSHSIPNLGYNMLGSGFFALGAFVAVRRFGANGKLSDLVWAGVCHGIASTAYPPLVLPTFLSGGMVWIAADKKEKNKAFWHYVAGGGLVVAVVLPILVRAGWTNLNAMIKYGVFLNPKATAKVFDNVVDWYQHAPLSFWMLPTVAVTIGALKLVPRWGLWMLPLVTLCFSLYAKNDLGGQLSMVVNLGLFAPLHLILIGESRIARSMFTVVWIPSFFGGVVTAFASTNGELNGAIGLFSAATLFLVFQAMAAEKLFKDGNVEKRLEPMLMIAPILLVGSMLLRFSFTVYRDAATQDLKVVVPSGPFKGIKTTKDRVAWLTSFEEAMKKHNRPNGRLLVYWEFPAGYLFSPMRAGGNTVWLVAAADQQAQVDYHKARLTGQNLAVKIKSYPGGPGAPGKTPLENWLDRIEHPIETSANWDITGE